MANSEMTIAEVLNDSLIRQMMGADRVSLKEMRKLLQDASLRVEKTAVDPSFSRDYSSICVSSSRQQLWTPTLPPTSSKAIG